MRTDGRGGGRDCWCGPLRRAMTDDEATLSTSDDAPLTDEEQADAVRRAALASDDILGTWVHLANSSVGLSVPMTLAIGGQVVSGTLIGAPVYLEGVATQLEHLRGGENSEAAQRALADSYRARAAEYLATEAEADGDSEEIKLPPPTAFIHLRAASISTPDGYHNIPFWRACLTKVSGWSLGS